MYEGCSIDEMFMISCDVWLGEKVTEVPDLSISTE
jgi:hypothetical protein